MFVLGYTVEALEATFNARIEAEVTADREACAAIGWPFNEEDTRRVAASREGMYSLSLAIRCARLMDDPNVATAREALLIHACRALDHAMRHGIQIGA